MDFKKFKHDIKNEKIVIPSMKDKVRQYSKQEKIENNNIKEEKFVPKLRYILALIPVLIMIIMITIISIPQIKTTALSLNTLKDYDDLQRVLSYSKEFDVDLDIFNDDFSNDNLWDEKGDFGMNSATGTAPENSSNPNQSTDDYYDTNNQEENVIESDIVKTDGEKIYYFNSKHSKIYIYNTLNSEMKEIKVEQNYYNYTEPLYITERYLIYITAYYEELNITLYDKETLEVVKQYENTGNLIDTRITNGVLYIVYNQRNIESNPVDYIDGQKNEYAYTDVHYTDALINQGYTFIVALDLNNLEMNVEVLLGVNQWTTVYATEKNIYLATSNSCFSLSKYTINGSRYTATAYQTSIVRYELNGSEIIYGGIIITNGVVKNQFYLDEFDNHLRVVLQQQNTVETGDNKLEVYDLSKNELDGTIKKVASIDSGIGKPGEQIKSVKFDDYSCLIVTYLVTDPLYYIDLTNQLKPEIKGEYQEPGYNTYLHYINENLAIGFGIDNTYKLGLYVIENNTPNKVQQINYNYIPVANNHKALYIENDIFGFSSKEYQWSDIKSKYDIYTIDYTTQIPQLLLLKSFELLEGNYERMIRIKDEYYLISTTCIDKLNLSFEITESIQFIKK